MAVQTEEEYAAASGYVKGPDDQWVKPRAGGSGWLGADFFTRLHDEQDNAAFDSAYYTARTEQESSAAGADTSALVDVEGLKADPTNVLGALTRAQYLSEKAMFEPIEDRLRNMTTYESPEKTSLSINDAIGSNGYVNKALDNSYNQGQRQTSRYGTALNSRQQDAVDSNATMKRSTSVVDAANRIRQRLVSRNEQIMLGGSPADPRATTTTGGAA